jgi:hypothetical protein
LKKENVKSVFILALSAKDLLMINVQVVGKIENISRPFKIILQDTVIVLKITLKIRKMVIA